MTVIGIEATGETALRTALAAQYVTAALSPAPVIRAWTLDDDTEETAEVREYPVVTIVSNPGVPIGFQQGNYDIPVTISVQTHVEDDPKRASLWAIYKETRRVLEDQALASGGITFFFIIGEGGTSGIEEPINFMNIVGEMKACG